ncbi:MAG TPA: aminodeoxychorismate synthase component I [Candidatus Acidoferrum sp.]|jgi:aminodeoxychorismate synthase component I|nr:aminodeoxychorismate synthase component I [Candidatus Acidoferrum sp.]
MRPVLQEFHTNHTPESLIDQLQGEPGLVLLRTGLFDSPLSRFSFVAARPFLTVRAFGSRCELRTFPVEWSVEHSSAKPVTGSGGPAFCPATGPVEVQFGDPWRLLESWMSRFELLDDVDLPFPLGGCFGYWGYDLKNFVEPKLARRAIADLELPDCCVGFYASLIAFDHHLGKTCMIATGLNTDGSRSEGRARRQLGFWQHALSQEPGSKGVRQRAEKAGQKPDLETSNRLQEFEGAQISANLSRAEFIARVERAQAYIRSGDIYQVNLSQRLTAPWAASGWVLFRRLGEVSPAPFSAWLDCGDFQIASTSPESFLRLSGAQIRTRPIKGTRPRAANPALDARLAYELQTSGKEVSELIMITDLLRNDLGKVCEFGSVQVPELIRLERFPQVQHLVSTVEGRLRPGLSHLEALRCCFPGGSITGAPKFRAMEIIDELEPLARGPYTGALGYFGFNRESQLSIIIRTAICKGGEAHFQVGAGIVADSQPAAEYDETLAKARGFFEALRLQYPRVLTVRATGPVTNH